jgi:hypothetical protein
VSKSAPGRSGLRTVSWPDAIALVAVCLLLWRMPIDGFPSPHDGIAQRALLGLIVAFGMAQVLQRKRNALLGLVKAYKHYESVARRVLDHCKADVLEHVEWLMHKDDREADLGRLRVSYDSVETAASAVMAELPGREFPVLLRICVYTHMTAVESRARLYWEMADATWCEEESKREAAISSAAMMESDDDITAHLTATTERLSEALQFVPKLPQVRIIAATATIQAFLKSDLPGASQPRTPAKT